MIPEAVTRWIAERRAGQVIAEEPIGGGCINNGTRLKLDSGVSYFLKMNSNAPHDMFEREAEGLLALQEIEGTRVPAPLFWEAEFILLEDLKPAKRRENYWETLGRQVAHLHQHTNPQFGFNHDNYLGTTPQPNSWTEDGYEFFAQHRLGFQAKLARDKGLLNHSEAEAIAKLANRLPQLVPIQPASLIHGDLWGGNAISDERGQPAIIDPAAHYGWAEAELAMTTLFGGFSSTFYTAYVETRTLDIGWSDRLPLYNLYQLLNHLNLFGAGYHGQVMEIVHHFS